MLIGNNFGQHSCLGARHDCGYAALRRRRRGYRHRGTDVCRVSFAEVLPKTIAALYPEKVAYPSSFLLAPLQILMMPLVWLLNTITRLLMRLMGIKTDIVVSGSLSKEELRTIVHESRSQISRRNQDMLLSVLDLEKVSVDDIMVPRNEIIGIDINDDWKSIERQLTHSPHGRIVLYRDSLDDAISMLRVREARRLMAEKKSSPKR